jgi:hypothetical protein
MSLGRLARLVGLGLVVTIVLVVLIVAATSPLPSSPGAHDVTVDLKVVKDYPNYYWAAVFVPEPLADEGCRKVAKSIGDKELKGSLRPGHGVRRPVGPRHGAAREPVHRPDGRGDGPLGAAPV